MTETGIQGRKRQIADLSLLELDMVYSLSRTGWSCPDIGRRYGIQSGLFGRAWFNRGTRRAIVVSNSAVIERGQLRGLYVADSNGIVRWRVVTLAQKIADQVEVLSGLGEGEQIVLNPGSEELDGKKIGTKAADEKGEIQ